MTARVVLGFDASSVAGCALERGFRSPRFRTILRTPLPEGALVPSGVEPNLAQPGEVRAALSRLREQLGEGGRACLVLPAGVAHFKVLDVPAGVEPRDFARFRLLHGLPYAPEEAVVDILGVGGRRIIAAAVRRSILEEYEAAAADCGFSQERLDLAPLAALGALAKRSDAVQVVLGDVGYCIAVREGGTLRVLRSRRRDTSAGEAERLGLELERSVQLAQLEGRPRVRMVGAGARELASGLALRHSIEVGWPGGGLDRDAGEHAWLGAAQ